MDVLSNVLSTTRLGAAVLAQAELIAPWGLEVDPMMEVAVHVVLRGECWLGLGGADASLHLEQGDVVLIGRGVAHSVADDPRTPVAPYRNVLAAMRHRVERLTEAERERTTHVLCAKYLFEHRDPHPLVSLLPPLIHLRAKDSHDRTQLSLLLSLLRIEASQGGRGSELVVPRLVDTMLVFIVRAWIEAQPEGVGGWFGALREPAITRALALIHEQPRSVWSVESLARAVGQSRATFARHFVQLVGEPPIAYLARWRMCLAVKLLRETTQSVEEIASAVGYESGAALSKAFRRVHGTSPGRFRTNAGPQDARVDVRGPAEFLPGG